MNNLKIVLSICIPTYNRASILEESLKRLQEQIKGISYNSIEIIVSDNCSLDNTSDIVKKYIEQNVPIVYNRNNKNLGSNGNFLKCIDLAKGKYIWLLGDDDFLTEGTLSYLISLLKDSNYGLVHLRNTNQDKIMMEYSDKVSFLKDVSYMSTFMSANIFNSSNIKNIEKPEQYAFTWFIQIPFYVNAAINSQAEKNLIVSGNFLDCGKASATNGGFNYFDVCCKYYLFLWKEFERLGWIGGELYSFIKKDICRKWIIPRAVDYLILGNLDANYNLERGWKTIMEEYKYEPYLYYSLIIYLIKTSVSKFLKFSIKK